MIALDKAVQLCRSRDSEHFVKGIKAMMNTPTSPPQTTALPSLYDDQNLIKSFSVQADDLWKYLLRLHQLDVANGWGIKPSELPPFAVQLLPEVSFDEHVLTGSERIEACLGGLTLECGADMVQGKRVHIIRPVLTPWLADRAGFNSFEGPFAFFRYHFWRAYALLCRWMVNMNQNRRQVSFSDFLAQGFFESTPPEEATEADSFLLTNKTDAMVMMHQLDYS